MRRIIVLYCLGILFPAMLLTGQEIPEYLRKRDEIYFSFVVKERAKLSEAGRIISIDQVKGDTVKAYANVEQFLQFREFGYDITLLPPPGDGPGVAMWDPVADGPLTTWNYYPTYSGYETLMAQFQSAHPALCHLDTIGTLASGRRLLVLKISDNVNSDESEPEFFYSSSIHGDETTGYILLMHLADYLLTNYGTNPEATDLVNNLEIFICPLANPDGTYYGGNNSVSGARRFNINGVDLNRNYPDPQNGPHPDGKAWQPETVAFMDFASQHHFVAGANFHGGVEVVNYPWDTWATLHADDNWYQYISREYADTVHQHAIAGYMTYLNNGITNGYAWYEVNGGRQDYMNYYHHCREITIEISDVKLLPAAELTAHWDYNWRSCILLMKEARYGIHGVITDQPTGAPMVARVTITGHDNNGSEVYSTANPGDYHRPVKAGTYTLEISAPCYQTLTLTGVTVADHATLTLDIQLVPVPAVTAFPWNEGFENGGLIPAFWSQEQVNSSGLNWTFITGNGGSNPSAAHGGTRNACLKDFSTADHKTRLITPPLDLSNVPEPRLKFWHYQAVWGSNQDQLSVYYRTSAAGAWTLLATYPSSVTAWTQRTLSLPDRSAYYCLAFEGNAKYGYGVCVDDVEVSTSCTQTYPVSVSVTASANPVTTGDTVTFTALPVNGGSAPAYQWKVNANNANNANNATYSYIPADSDQVWCVLTSSEACATGNPAVSDTLVLIVAPVPMNDTLQGIAVTGAGCFDALQSLHVAGDGTAFIVHPGGTVALVAGQRIVFHPGTAVLSGGALSGQIKPAGLWCPAQRNGNFIQQEETVSCRPRIASEWNLFPNPTTGDFTVERRGERPVAEGRIEIRNMQGILLLSKELKGERTMHMSLSERPAGMYLVRVLSGSSGHTFRILRQD